VNVPPGRLDRLQILPSHLPNVGSAGCSVTHTIHLHLIRDPSNRADSCWFSTNPKGNRFQLPTLYSGGTKFEPSSCVIFLRPSSPISGLFLEKLLNLPPTIRDNFSRLIYLSVECLTTLLELQKLYRTEKHMKVITVGELVKSFKHLS
jgi:hypothetical protein